MVEKICHLLQMTEIYEKYNEIWEVVRKLLILKFTVGPNRDDKYIIAKLKIFKKINRTTFTDNVIHFEKIIILVFLQYILI